MNALLVQKTAVEQTKATMIKEVARLNDPEDREEIMRTQLNLGKSGKRRSIFQANLKMKCCIKAR